MQLGMIGLGRMGANMVRRLLRGGHDCVVFDPVPEAVESLVRERAIGAASVGDLIAKLRQPRFVWLMVPAAAVDGTIEGIRTFLSPGDTVIDGGNSYYVDDIQRSKMLAAHGVRYIDVGTSGGVWGLERGYCMMIGGDRDSVQRLDPIFKTLAPGPGDAPRRPCGPPRGSPRDHYGSSGLQRTNRAGKTAPRGASGRSRGRAARRLRRIEAH